MAVSITTTATATTIGSTGGNTASFNDVYQYIQTLAAATKSTITRTGDTGSFTYSVNKTTPNPFRSLTFAANSKIRIDSGSYILFDKTDSVFSTTPVLTVSDGAILHIQQGVVIDVGSAARSTFYGAVSASGTTQRPIIVSNSCTNYFYPYMESVWNNVVFKNDYLLATGAGTDLQLTQAIGKAKPLTFTNLTITSSIAGGNYGYPIYFQAGGCYSNIVIDGFTISNKKNYLLNNQSSAKLKNGFIDGSALAQTAIILCTAAGNAVSPAYQTSVDDTLYPTGRFQSLTTFQNVTFAYPSTAVTLGALQSNYNGYLALKNCTFINTGSARNYGVYSINGSITLQTGSTYIGSWTNPRFGWSSNGTFLQAHQVSLTVVDDSTSLPIQNATITVIQSSVPRKQQWCGVTNAQGKLLNVFGDPMLLAQGEIPGASAFSYWSSQQYDVYHSLMVTKVGYDNYYLEKMYVTGSFAKTIRLIPTTNSYIQIGNGVIL